MESHPISEVVQTEVPKWVLVAKGLIQESLNGLFGNGASCGDCRVSQTPDGEEEWSINIWNYAQGIQAFTLPISEALNKDTLRDVYDSQAKKPGGVI
jgi:hypothetical protein